jgi:hypothetical protein
MKCNDVECWVGGVEKRREGKGEKRRKEEVSVTIVSNCLSD